MRHHPTATQSLAAATGSALLLALLAGVGTSLHSVDQALAQDDPEVRIAWYRVGHTAPLYVLPRFAEQHGVKVDLIEFKRYADARTAIASGDLEFAAVGPQDVSFAVAAGSGDVIGVAGLATLGDCLVVRNGIDVSQWSDFAGLRVAVGAGSISWTKFVTALVEAEVPYAEVDVVNIAGGGAEYLTAMERGDVDSFIAWQPHCAEAIFKEVGYYPPTDHNATETIGGINSIIVANRRFLEEHPETAQKLMDAYVEAVEWVRSNPDDWTADYTVYSGIEPEVAALALEGIRLDYTLPQQQIEQLTDFLYEHGVLNVDVTDRLFPDHFNYDLLANSTGKSAEELGRK